MKRVLILQGILADYRRPVFNRLAEFADVTVAHSGAQSRLEQDRFYEVLLPKVKIGPFFCPPPFTVHKLIAEADVTIAMFDLGWPSYVCPVLWPIAWRNSGRYIFWGHRYGTRPFANRLREFFMKRADGLLMYGNEHHERMFAAGIDPARVFVAPNTMDVPNHQDCSGCPKSTILYVGRLQDRKRLELAIADFAAILQQIPPHIDFEIIGDGPPAAQYRAQVAALGITDRVRFLGRIDDNFILAQHFSKAIAYISPGPVGLGGLHSFAFGVPVLTLRHGYHGPEFHNMSIDNSIVVDTDAEFSNALMRLITEPGLAARLGKNAYNHYAESRTIDIMVQGFREAIDGVNPERRNLR
jgi:glycosyltransferase involved in cell wall biosynthesis